MDQIQEQNSFGVSQFMEGARYQYALEAELARTISHIGAVRDARVHLALPKRSSFIREQKSASASVLLTLYRGQALEPGQASSIVHLVASSVPNLTTQNVTLIDQQGRLLSSQADEWNDVQTLNQFKHTQRLEDNYKRRIEDMLTPLLGPGRIRAEVVASLDFTVTEETREAFDPQNTVVRSEQINEERRNESEPVAAGVPGALSNQPPEEVAAIDANSSETAAETTVNSTLSAMRNFEVDRTISRTRPQSGTIQRLSVAVLIDDSPMEGAEEGTESGLTPEAIERYTSLVREAVGFDESRGDTVAVVTAAFRELPAVEPPEEPAFWEKPAMRDAMKQGAGVLLVLILGFGVVRPMLKSLVSANMVSSGHYIAAGGDSSPAGMGMAQLGPGGAVPLAAPSYDEKVAAAKNITGHDPARVAAVVRKWVTTDD
ncbi:MAG: flagellar basal-body MS-ring/collar protein FliF [Gammaproteobacteria bacterium]|nr:flagellar basal-body MS-ring/collar protein FliF [Gammaproteobacteria bacterium]